MNDAINAQLFGALNAASVCSAVESINAFTRSKLREPSLFRQLLADEAWSSLAQLYGSQQLIRQGNRRLSPRERWRRDHHRMRWQRRERVKPTVYPHFPEVTQPVVNRLLGQLAALTQARS